jgi:hypothetical protein
MRKSLRLPGPVFMLIFCLLGLSACTAEKQINQHIEIPEHGWVLLVNHEGPHYIGPEWWEKSGIDASQLNYETIQLQKESSNIPYLWIDDGDEVGLLFYAQVESSRSGKWGAYTLESGKPGVKMAEQLLGLESTELCQEKSIDYVEYEQNNSYRSTAPLTVPWLWTVFHPLDSFTLTVPLTDSISGPVTVTTWVWGQSQMIQDPDHQMRLVWQDTQAEEHFWDGNEVEVWDSVFTINNETLPELVLTSPGETEAPVEVSWLDKIKVTWLKSLIKSGPDWQRWFPGNTAEACWTGYQDENLIALLVSADGNVTYAKAAAGIIPQKKAGVGWVGEPQLAPGPAYIRTRNPLSSDALKSVEYLVIAPQVFHDALTSLLDFRSKEGLTVSLVTPEQVYDTFGQGIAEPEVMNVLIKKLANDGKLRYVLLVGDASSQIMTSPEMMFLRVPAGWVNTSVVGETPSDFALTVDAEGTPLVAIGRFPAADESEVTSMVNKTLGWEPNSRLLFVSDDEVEFENFTDSLIEVSPSDERLSAAESEARERLLSWLRKDPGILIYSGHGSLPMLGDEQILTQEDAGSWDEPTVVIAWSCLCASFTHPSYQGLGESWLQSKKGTVAFLGPTGETTSTQQRMMAIAVQRALVSGERIGDALLSGWQHAQSDDAKASFLLLGDPALRPFTAGSE